VFGCLHPVGRNVVTQKNETRDALSKQRTTGLRTLASQVIASGVAAEAARRQSYGLPPRWLVQLFSTRSPPFESKDADRSYANKKLIGSACEINRGAWPRPFKECSAERVKASAIGSKKRGIEAIGLANESVPGRDPAGKCSCPACGGS
jgi:hypothetical protein